MNIQELLTLSVLALSSWTLKEVISLKVQVAAIKQRIKDLPCSNGIECPTEDET